MTFPEYSTLFEDILHTDKPQPPYNNPQYLDYVKLNWSRMNRWFSYMYMKKKAILNNNIVCQKRMQAIRDTMEILLGKWKFHILGTLMQSNSLRFMDLLREVDGIGAKMLSKELQDMEINRLVTRRVLDTKPVTVEYEITEHGRTLAPIIDEIAKWGIDYREVLYKKKPRT